MDLSKPKYTCKLCKANGVVTPFEDRSSLLLHYAHSHPDHVPYRQRVEEDAKIKAFSSKKLGTMEAVRDAEKALHQAVAALDQERDQLQQRILEIDNTIARYKKL